MYRSSQFFAALLGTVDEQEVAEARNLLGPELYKIFRAMPGSYRRHALNVLRRVRASGCHDTIVGQAALLHDSGKYDPASGRCVTLAHRVAVVLLEAVPPGRKLLATASSHSDSRGIKGRVLYPFYLSKRHAQIGAVRAVRYGAAPEVAQLIARHHHSERQDNNLRVLQAADDRS